MKKILVFLIIAALLIPSTAYAQFWDMEGKNEEMQKAVSLLTDKHYISGVSDTEFAPDDSITRSQYAAIVLRVINRLEKRQPYYLKDVTKSVWYYYVAGSAYETGIMSGYEDNTFRGNEIIPKVQAVSIAARILSSMAGATGEGVTLNYADAIPQWAEEDVKVAVNCDLTGSEGYFNAEGPMTRGDAALMLAKVYEHIKEQLPAEGYTGNVEYEKPPLTIVIDPGHGKDSGYMTDDEKISEGWLFSSDKDQWGEWRHWLPGTTWQDCHGCDGRGACWYRMENGDRDTEPAINMNNAKNAAKYLEEMGYEVRLTRHSDNENPSMTKRLIYCYPNNDTSAMPDADLFVCLHSNAGGGRGSAYIELADPYTQAGIPADYSYIGNTLGKYINDEITSTTSMSKSGDGKISGLPELVLFCKSPIPIAYLEIGFFDNDNDLSILNSETENIGKAVANGINKYCIDSGMKN